MISSSDIRKAGILIVDDREADVLLLTQMLRGAGYVSVTSTGIPREVCGLHRRNRYDLILLDLEMPGLDGFEVMAGLKEIEPEGYLPVLVVTAHPEHKLRALEGGAIDFIDKPFDLAEVLARVRNLLEVRLLHEAARQHGRRMESLALKDPLTGLANRNLLNGRMTMALDHARRNQTVLAVVYLDLDGFKQVNDTLGHGVGDTLLKSVAGRMTAAVRNEDTVARMGGDEFMIGLWHVTGSDHAVAVALKTIDALSQPYVIDAHPVRITASAGVAVYPVHGGDADALMTSADLALREAKRAGKNACRLSTRSAPSVPSRRPQDPIAAGTSRSETPA